MVFNSLQFLVFFPVVTILYFLSPHRYRWFLLLAASCYFYMSFVPVYILILAFTIVVDYFAGILIEQSQGTRRKWMLAMSIIANVGILSFFKYYDFFNQNLSLVLHLGHLKDPLPFLNILLPLGLSFHTFQAMSYTIEVYRGKYKAERHFGIYSLYVMFFPQLVAGPIERPQNLIHQFREQHHFDKDEAAEGLKMMLWGLFKKVVIADGLSTYVNYIYDNGDLFKGTTLIVATFFFFVQVYCDFSGYSDIAIGAAKVMGIKLMTNFKRPLFSRSIAEFWTRWHISLMTWFRDYLYFPLGGSRVPPLRWAINILFVFTLSGFWHGAKWNYVLWGFVFAIYMIMAKVLAGPKQWFNKVSGLDNFPRIKHVLDVVLTVGLVSINLVFFRSNTLGQAFHIYKNMLNFHGPLLFMPSANVLLNCCFDLFILFVIEFWEERSGKFMPLFNHKWASVRLTSISLFLYLMILFGVFNGAQFIYFQF